MSLGVIRVADVAAHRQPEQLAAEVIFKARACNFLSVVEIFWTNEAHHRVH
jgi:hypothetical protein